MEVDNGLRRVQGRRVLTQLLEMDLPELARSLTSVIRGHAKACVVRVGGSWYVEINGTGQATLVPREDWKRILPLIEDGTLSTQVLPVESAVRSLDAVVRLSASTVDYRDPLYQRVYGTLIQLFKQRVPT